MVLINVAQREISCKIVYYGPGLCGKTTNIQVVHDKTPEGHKGKLTSLATEGDRTLFFDFLPLDLGNVGGMRTKFQLYTVPGQVYYNATRKLVLRGADGVIFVADSAPEKMQENIESLENLIANLKEQGINIEDIPLVFQWNKRDLPNAVPVEELQAKLNRWNAPAFEAVAIKGEGVFSTLKCISGLVLERISRKAMQRPGVSAAPSRPVASPTPAMAERPTAPPPPAVSQPVVTQRATPSSPLAATTRASIPGPAPTVTPGPAMRRPSPAVPPPVAKPISQRRGLSVPSGKGITNKTFTKPVASQPYGKPSQAPMPAVPVKSSEIQRLVEQGLSWGVFALVVVFLIGAILFLLFSG